MSYLKRYKDRVLAKGKNAKEIEEFTGKRNFKYMLDNKTSPTVHTVIVELNDQNSDVMENVEVNCEISNVTFNDQTKYDEKYVKFEMEENITYGSYVNWKGAKWLILFEENNSFEIYRTFTMRRCNNTFNFKYNGVVYHIPQVVKNLTLYSDGLDEESYISKPDAQRQIMMCDNELTAKIKVGTRVMLTNSTVYVITHIDDFSHSGVRTMICKQTPLHSLDDVVNNIAYNEDSEATVIPPTTVEIEGDEIVYMGDTVTYKINNTNSMNYTWKVSNTIATIINSTNDECIIEVINDIKYVNKTFNLELYDNGNLVDTVNIVMRGLM